MKHLVVVVALGLLSCITLIWASSGDGGRLQVGFPVVKLQQNERVVSVEMDLTAAEVIAINNIPEGWFITIDNDPSWHTKIRANTRVGTAALDAKDLQRMRVIVAKHEFEDLKFDISATLSVTKDYRTERSIRLSRSELISLAQ